MLGRRKRWCLGALVLALALGAVPSGADALGNPNNLSIIVLGDSYSSGAGGGLYLGTPGCSQSLNNYGVKYAQLLKAPPYRRQVTITTTACSGAVTRDITSPKGTLKAQVDALNPNYDLVLLTIGGNDDNTFGNIVAACLIPVLRDARRCDEVLTGVEREQADGTTVETRLTTALAGIRARVSPATKVVLLGYPYLEGDAGYVVPSKDPNVPAVAAGQRIRALTDTGERLQQKVVDALNTKQGTSNNVLVSVKKAFAGHELSATRTNPARWFIAPGIDGLASVYHPNPAGYEAEAKVLLADPRVPKADVR